MAQQINIEKRIETMKAKDILDVNKKHIIDFLGYKAAKGNSEARQAWYCSNLSQIAIHFNCDFKEATLKDIHEIMAWINKSKLSDWSKHDYFVTLKVFYKYFYKNYFPIKKYPDMYHKGEPEIIKDIEIKKSNGKRKLPRNLITFDDVKKIAEHTNNPRDRCLIITLFETGARISELTGLKISDVEPDKHGVRITLPNMTKSGARKLLLIWSAPSINLWLQHHPYKDDDSSYLFCGLQERSKGKELNYNHINRLIKEAGKKAGVNKPLNPHHFRHSRASILAKEFTEAQLCEYMGWVIGSTVSRTYVHLSGRDTDKAILELHDIVEKKEETKKAKNIECPRCQRINDPFSKFCNGCGLGLDEKSMMEYDEKQKQRGKIEEIIGEKDFDEYMGELVHKKVQELLKQNEKN